MLMKNKNLYYMYQNIFLLICSKELIKPVQLYENHRQGPAIFRLFVTQRNRQASEIRAEFRDFFGYFTAKTGTCNQVGKRDVRYSYECNVDHILTVTINHRNCLQSCPI